LDEKFKFTIVLIRDSWCFSSLFNFLLLLSSELELPDEAAFFSFFGAGFSSESDPEPDPLSELESFLAAAFFGAGLSLESLSELLESFLAAFFGAAFFGAGFSDSEESESEDDSTLAFFCGTTAFSAVFLALFLLSLLAAETPEAALDLF
jgi:hypothetical protein